MKLILLFLTVAMWGTCTADTALILPDGASPRFVRISGSGCSGKWLTKNEGSALRLLRVESPSCSPSHFSENVDLSRSCVDGLCRHSIRNLELRVIKDGSCSNIEFDSCFARGIEVTVALEDSTYFRSGIARKVWTRVVRSEAADSFENLIVTQSPTRSYFELFARVFNGITQQFSIVASSFSGDAGDVVEVAVSAGAARFYAINGAALSRDGVDAGFYVEKTGDGREVQPMGSIDVDQTHVTDALLESGEFQGVGLLAYAGRFSVACEPLQSVQSTARRCHCYIGWSGSRVCSVR